MKEATKITLEARETTGKEVCRKIRNEGYVPAVFYGPAFGDSVSVKLKLEDIAPVTKTTKWETTRLEVKLPDGSVEDAIIKELVRNPLTGDILHIDFYQLVKGHKITVNVPVELLNREACAGVKTGGILEFLEREVEMSVLPSQIPEKIMIDVSALELEESIHVRDLDLPESAETLTDENVVIVTVGRPREEEVEEVVEEEVPEVEVLAKGKKPEEE